MDLKRPFLFAIVSSLGFLITPAHGVPVDPPLSIPDASPLFLLGSACLIGYVVLKGKGKK